MFSSKRKYYFISCICFISFLSWIINTPNHPMANLNVDQIIKIFGYPSEVHEVTTEDGYINILNRIPYSERNKSNSSIPRVPVLLMHGMLQSAADYVLAGPDKALGLLLADRGFDVWMGNSRGSTWSRKHTHFNPNTQSEYWNFTGHEIAVYDTSATIDYILNITNQPNLHYIGFSQGTSELFIIISERPEYNKKIRLFSALSPVMFIEDVNNFFLNIALNNMYLLQNFWRYTKTDEIFTSNGFLSHFQKFICNGNSALMYLCLEYFKYMQGNNTQLDKALLPSLTSHLPAGLAVNHFIHSVQVKRSGILQKFDYGNKVNIKLYGQETPPVYNASKLTAPIALYYSKSDILVHWKNIEKIENSCPNVIRSYEIPLDGFCHFDFILGKDAAEFLYNSVIDEMIKY